MGRRGLSRNLKRVPPSAEAVARYLKLWNFEESQEHPELDLPRFDAPTLFGDGRDLELEVGCGTGEYLCALAAERPQNGFVGVDVSTKSLYVAVRQAQEQNLANIRFFRAPMQEVYSHLAPAALAAVYAHYPDPFVRTRGEHKVLCARFFQAVRDAMRVGGVLSVVSDKPELFEKALKLLEATPGWEKAHAERFLEGFDPPVRSRYQIKWDRYAVKPLRFEARRTMSSKMGAAS